MTLTYKLDLDILKMYLHIEMEFSGQGFQEPQTGQTHTETDATKHITGLIRGL